MIEVCRKMASAVYDLPMHQYVFDTPLDAYYERNILWYGGETRREKVKVQILRLTASFENVIFGNGAKYLAIKAVCSDGRTRDIYYHMDCSAFLVFEALKKAGVVKDDWKVYCDCFD